MSEEAPIVKRTKWSLAGEVLVRILLVYVGGILSWGGWGLVVDSLNQPPNTGLTNSMAPGPMPMGWHVGLFFAGCALGAFHYLLLGLMLGKMYKNLPRFSKWGLWALPLWWLFLPFLFFLKDWLGLGLSQAQKSNSLEGLLVATGSALVFGFLGLLTHRIGRKYRPIKSEGEW